MKAIRDIPFTQDFYWKGKQYKQTIRPRNPGGSFTVVCAEVGFAKMDRFNMPCGRMVEPVRIGNGS